MCKLWFFLFFFPKISKTLFTSILSLLTENWRNRKCFAITKINGLFTQRRSEPQTTTGKIKEPSPTSPELTLVILDKAIIPLARDPVCGQFKVRAKKSDQSVPYDIKLNRSYSMGQVPVFYRTQEPGSYL